MNIVVLVKQVPDSEALVQVKPDGTGVDIEDKYTLNFFDSVAIEEGLRIKEGLGEGTVTVLTLGTPKSAEVLRTGIAMGADQAVLIHDAAFDGSDEYATARVLSHALRTMECDLVLCGREAFDDSSGAVGPLVAEFLGMPVITTVTKVDVLPEERAVRVEKEIEGGKMTVRAPLPVVVTAQKGLNEPRVPPIMGVMKAMRTEIKTLDCAALGLSSEKVGRAVAKHSITRFVRPPQRPPVTMIPGDAADAVRELIRLLREEAKVV